MCTDPTDPHGPRTFRSECGPFLHWFWLNFVVDMWFIADICINFRTGFIREGHFVSDDWQVQSPARPGPFLSPSSPAPLPQPSSPPLSTALTLAALPRGRWRARTWWARS